MSEMFEQIYKKMNMKTKITIQVKSSKNVYQAKLIKSEIDFVNFTIAKSEVVKLINWGLINKSDNSSNDRDVYYGEFEFFKDEDL